MRRVVLLGARGFIGGHLLMLLKQRGVAVAAPSRAEADLTDSGLLERYLQAGDIVINAAGYANATDTTPAGRARLAALNVEGVRRLAEAARRRNVAQLIHLSSVAAMGPWCGSGIREGMLQAPRTPYAQSKRQGELILAAYGDIPITILRPTSVFGEGRGLAAALCRAICTRLVPLPAGGRALIPFSYVGNLAHAVWLTLDNPRCFHQTFIVGDARSYPLRALVAALAAALRVRPLCLPVPLALAQLGVAGLEQLARWRGVSPLLDHSRLRALTTSVSYDISALVRATGYSPPVSLEAAAERIAAWYRGRA